MAWQVVSCGHYGLVCFRCKFTYAGSSHSLLLFLLLFVVVHAGRVCDLTAEVADLKSEIKILQRECAEKVAAAEQVGMQAAMRPMGIMHEKAVMNE